MDSHSYCSPQADHARHCVLPSASRMLVHRLFRLQQDALATHIDMTCRWVLPFILYPLITVASLCKGLSARHAWLSHMQTVLYAVGVPLTLGFTVWTVRRNYLRIGEQQERCLRVLAETPEASPEWPQRARALFDAFDLDQSGSIDVMEMRTVVNKKCAPPTASASLWWDCRWRGGAAYLTLSRSAAFATRCYGPWGLQGASGTGAKQDDHRSGASA